MIMLKYLILLFFFLSPQTLLAAELGRLFLTPEQRAQLEVVRVKRDQRAAVPADAAPNATPAAPQGPDNVTYNGSIRRSDGKSTVWINGKPIHEKNALRNETDVSVLGIRPDGVLSIATPKARHTSSLKVGQSLDVTSGRIEESGTRHPPPDSTKLATSPSAAPTETATQTPGPRYVSRPSRESDFKESDPESGAAPAQQRTRK